MRIVIVEDHLMFREILRKVCSEELQHLVVGEAADGKQAVELVARTSPQLVLLDLHLPFLCGFEVVEEIRKTAPDVRILVLSSHCDEYAVFRAERAQVNGFVDKNTNTVATLKEAISAVAQGKAWFSETFRKVRAARKKDPNSFDKVLSDRERAVLALLDEPLSDEKGARRLAISEETVEKHRFNILRKLDLSGTTELVRYARQHGFTLTVPSSEDGATLP
ncbi:MAG: response regulator transcription factor [Opitutus sp.]|nr:response regulator transcription factor [Opitutus sp.]